MQKFRLLYHPSREITIAKKRVNAWSCGMLRTVVPTIAQAANQTIDGFMLYAGIGGETTVDGQYHTGNGRSCLLVAQEQGCTQQFLCIHITASGCAVQNLSGASGGSTVLMKQQRSVLGRDQETGGNGIATDACAGKMGCQPLGKVGNNPMLSVLSSNLEIHHLILLSH